MGKNKRGNGNLSLCSLICYPQHAEFKNVYCETVAFAKTADRRHV